VAIILFLFAVSAAAATDAASVARLVHAKDAGAALVDALKSSDPLVRATAARVAGVRNVKAVLPLLRELVPNETDAGALREEIRTLALLGEHADVDIAIAAASKRPPAFDAVIADAVARRGGEDAIDLYMSRVRKLRDTRGFFTRALWGHENYFSTTAGWLLSSRVANGWEDFLAAMYAAGKAVPHARMMAAVENGSEEIRQESAWYLVRGYALNPSLMHEDLQRLLLAERTAESTDREDFARELLRRMLGKPPSNPQRWLQWLAMDEADARVPDDAAVLKYFTPDELALRESPAKKAKSAKRVQRATEVPRAAFALPGTLPAGLAEKIVGGRKCGWVGVASASVDNAGRVEMLDLDQVTATCREQLDTIVKLTYASNATVASAHTSSNILLARAAVAPLCLDEAGDDAGPLVRAGDPGVTAPVAKRRVPPVFPESVRRNVARGVAVEVIVEAVISRTGCVRSVSLAGQSRYPELNGAVVLAASQWTFEPAKVNGKPVDSIFTLPVSFTLH
jgi:TonB family protein